MICRQGPLDGIDIPDSGRMFFLYTSYDNNGESHTVHVYGRVGVEWQYQPKATAEATKGFEIEIQP